MRIMDIKELAKKYKTLADISCTGWVRSIRDNGALVFINMYDGTDPATIQVVVKRDCEGFTEIAEATTGSAILVSGKIIITEGKKQPFEISATRAVLLKKADSTYPLQKKEHSLEFLREIAHLRPRSATFGSVFRIRSELSFAIHRFFNSHGFVHVHTPILTTNDAEGAGEAFRVMTRDQKQFFSKDVSLTVSGQLNAEAFAQSFKKVYTFGPTFRAERSFTSRHVSEFWMVEPEVAFMNLEQNMALIEAFVKAIAEHILTNCADDLTVLSTEEIKLQDRIKHLIGKPFLRMRYEEALKILVDVQKKEGLFGQDQFEFGIDLSSEHEKYLAETHAEGPIFITHYPKQIKAFYMKAADEKTVLACDLLFPTIGEVVGGSQREDDYDRLMERCQELKIDTTDLQWYIDLRKYGYYMSSGFGLGFERILMFLTGTENIRDVIPFARHPGTIGF